MKRLAVIVLTYNEEIHIRRLLQNLLLLHCDIFIVDSFSEDGTVTYAKEQERVTVLQRGWTYHADQLNWAIGEIESHYDYLLRVDADEVLDATLINSVKQLLVDDSSHSGFFLKRSIVFQGAAVKYGGVSKLSVLRMWKSKTGKCDDRLMDEKIIVNGTCATMTGDLIDNNLNDMNFWVNKHLGYARREAEEIVNRGSVEASVGFMSIVKNPDSFRGFLRSKVYYKVPSGLRVFSYLLFRLFIKGGILDRRNALLFHLLQAGLYRLLVDYFIADLKSKI